MTVSVMITTRDRSGDLRRTLAKVVQLNPAADEVIVTADGCRDDTVEMIRNEFPSVKLRINETGKGSVASRDAMLREASSDLVLSLDDDSYPENPDCLVRIIQLFRSNSKLAVAHFPQRSDEYPASLTQTDFGAPRITNSFANSGACYRRKTYLELPGFPLFFFHAYEEPDYALQCVAAGLDVLYYPGVVVRHHFTTVMRNEIRTHQRHARNEWWSIWLRCPWPYAILLLIYRPLSELRYAIRRGPSWVIREPLWWWDALKGVSRCIQERSPLAWKSYIRWLLLNKVQR